MNGKHANRPNVFSEKTSLGLHRGLGGVSTAPLIMAKKSWIARNKRKAKTVDKYADLRRKLKEEKDYVGL